MARDSAGNYSLPPGNPVQPGTTIETNWANTTMDDVAQALTDSLDRNGRGGMLAPFKFADGAVNAPGAAWTQEPTTGLYRPAAGELRVTVLGVDRFRWRSSAGGYPQVWNNTDSVWETVLTAQGDSVAVPAGTADGQTLRWDVDPAGDGSVPDKWALVDSFTIDDKGLVFGPVMAYGDDPDNPGTDIVLNNPLSQVVVLTQAQYDAITTPDANTTYLITA